MTFLEKLRKKKQLERSQEIAREVKDGLYQPAAFNKEESWWPQRPLIEKDPEAIKKLYEHKEPWFCLLKCDCGNSRTENLDELESDKCETCGNKMRLVNKWPAGDY